MPYWEYIAEVLLHYLHFLFQKMPWSWWRAKGSDISLYYTYKIFMGTFRSCAKNWGSVSGFKDQIMPWCFDFRYYRKIVTFIKVTFKGKQ